MNFIPAERFLELSEEIQKVFLDWWKPSEGDLYCTRQNYDVIDVIINVIKNRVYGLEKDFLGDSNLIDFNLIPLLQMHQLIQFIEDKGYIFTLDSCSQEVNFSLLGDITTNRIIKCNDLLQALFQVAIKIAEKEIEHE